ncbi:MAG: secretin and TonB N-terminal domain-containing protein [Smithella sp.]
MKKYLFYICATILIFFFFPAIISIAAETGYLNNIFFEQLPGKERVVLNVSIQPVITVESTTNNNLIFKLENIVVPENLRHSFGKNELNNVSNVVPAQQSFEGKEWTYLTVNIKNAVPYVVRQEGKNIYIDFNISDLPEKKIFASKIASSGKKLKIKKETVTGNTDKYVSLDFQDADIKSVLRLMAEYGNMSIVSGDDVRGNVTLNMKNVPWSQALDTILDVKGLAKKKNGGVISVMTLERMKKEEADKTKAEDLYKERELKLMVEKGLLKQILIEAKIVEATESFVRNIGINWGFGVNQSVSGGDYGLGISAGSNASSTNINAARQNYPSQITQGFTTSTGTPLQMAAVNFPASAAAVGTPAIGVVFGGASAFLEVQLAALESNATGKVLSAPKVLTMEGVKATIKQGSEIPYTTPASGTSPATISFKEALLKLEVTPKITDEGKISMEIKANHDEPDYITMAKVSGSTNPPINKSEIDSKVVVQNGDTIVIGGILKSSNSTSVSGLPWLQKIPVLGWLFKTENTSRDKKQLLIFITPKILQNAELAGSIEKNN